MASKDLVSTRTRRELREYFVAFSTLSAIRNEFDAADIDEVEDYEPPVSGQRRTLIEKHYRTLDFSRYPDVRKFLNVFESAMADLERWVANPNYIHHSQAKLWLDKLTNLLKREGLSYKDGKIAVLSGAVTLADVKQHAIEFDADYLARQVERIETSIETDPDQAIGSAKELIETCCKTILSERGKPVTGRPEIPELISATLKELALLPDDVHDQAKGSDTIKKILRTLGTIPQGLAELRNLYGTGHGKDGKFKGLTPRHARLAVGAARTVVSFLFESHQAREEQKHK